MVKVEEHNIEYLKTRMEEAFDLLQEVWEEYTTSGDIEEVDSKLIAGLGLVYLMRDRLQKLTPD